MIPEALIYLNEGCYPDGAFRNWKSVSTEVSGASSMERMLLMADPQTSGGLLIACAQSARDEVNRLLLSSGLPSTVIGSFGTPQAHPVLFVE